MNFYEVLGADPDDSMDEIKKVYRLLARRWHPDNYRGDTKDQIKAREKAEERFKEISEANNTLTDPRRRREYEDAEGISRERREQSRFRKDFLRATVGKSPVEKLHYATQQGLGYEMNALLEAGVVPLQKTLRLAVQRGWATWVQGFIDHGAKPTLEMLDLATANADKRVARILTEADVMPDEITLGIAVEQGWEEGINVYIASGLRPTPAMLRVAIRNLDENTVNILLKEGVSTRPDEELMRIAVEQRWTDCVRMFIRRGAQFTPEHLDISTRNLDANTSDALLGAGVKPSPATMAFLREKGWSITEKRYQYALSGPEKPRRRRIFGNGLA